MNLKFNARSGLKAAALCGIALGFGLASIHARADEWNKKTIVRFDEPTQIRDTYLEPGTYVLKLVDSPSNRNVVQIFTADERHVINTIIAIPNYRLKPTGNSRFAFWETPPGSVRALRAWFYPGDNYGQEFAYPKNLRQIAYAAPAQPAPAPEAVPAPEAEPAPSVEAAPEPAPAPAPQPEAAQPPPAPETQPQAEPQAPPPPPPSELPKTATAYPMFGLGGLICLGLFTWLRATKAA
ncbi:MAG TPA: hypothetical protein VMG40_05355 [Bryobacteraceae bacterium]|nr:hypothetical protein [Bryobacteraceae bacterium]